MKILGIETSCDETAAAIVEVSQDKTHGILLSTVTATSLALHAKTGGIIPEIAARNQIKDIIPVIYEALLKAGIHLPSSTFNPPELDAIAVTYGPGLIGSLLVGVETAKTLSYIWKKPFIPVNHLFGHIYANFVCENIQYPISNIQLPTFPAIGLIISGGHTDLLLMKSHDTIIWLGGTRDDAAGEAFDKIGRMLGLPYPAGPAIEQLAKNGNPKAYHFPRPLMYDKAWDFSFSGLKTAVLREVEKLNAGVARLGDPHRVPGPSLRGKPSDGGEERQDPELLNDQTIADICRGVQDAISDVLVYKTLQAAEKFGVKSIALGGGVAANQTLIETFKQSAISHKLSAEIFHPQKSLCTDNAAMIATAAIFQGKEEPWQEVSANPEVYFE